MVKPLTFKGDKKSKKRKRAAEDDESKQSKESSTALTTTAQAAATAANIVDDDDTWTTADLLTDISGPILLCFSLPSFPPYCIATDANGKVFASQIENIYTPEGSTSASDAVLATAEPHDVRQVWVASQVAGTEGFSFKGHHGKYLSCDKIGLIFATREAIGVEESFIPVPDEDGEGTGRFSIRTAREGYLTFSAPESSSKAPSTAPILRGDAPEPSATTMFHIRMQARFKKRIKAFKEAKAREKISRRELEELVGRKLEDEEVKMLKRARRDGGFHEAVLDVRVKGKHDKFAS